MFYISELYSIEIGRNNSVNCEWWKVRVGKDAVEPIISFTFTWSCIVTNFFIIKTNRHTNFQIYSGTKFYMFRAVSLPILRSCPLYIWHWHMLYRFDDSLFAGSGCSFLILHAGCRQNCITCVSAKCTVDNSQEWAEKLLETRGVSYQNYFGN